jgi:hypothetical protein
MNPQVVSEMKGLYNDQLGFPDSRVPGLTSTDVDRWSGLIAGSRSKLHDQVALILAQGFQTPELSFAFCDAVINDLHGVITSADEHRPEFFWEVYLAFDEGEYYHGNNREEDPVEVYTPPMIFRALDGPLPDFASN